MSRTDETATMLSTYLFYKVNIMQGENSNIVFSMNYIVTSLNATNKLLSIDVRSIP